MKLFFIILSAIIHSLLVLSKPNGLRRHVSEMILLRAQLVVVRRKLRKAPPLSPYKRRANLCRMFNEIASGRSTPARLSHDNDPLFHYHFWACNMSIYSIDEVRSVPFVPTSHQFCERAIGTVRREFTDKILFLNRTDLERKLNSYRGYFNIARVHSGIGGRRPQLKYRDISAENSSSANLKRKKYWRGLFIDPEAA